MLKAQATPPVEKPHCVQLPAAFKRLASVHSCRDTAGTTGAVTRWRQPRHDPQPARGRSRDALPYFHSTSCGYCLMCRIRTRCVGIIHASSWMPCSFSTPQDCTSSKVTEIEEHLSSGSPLPDHVVDHFRRMSNPDVWAVHGGVRRAEEGGE